MSSANTVCWSYDNIDNKFVILWKSFQFSIEKSDLNPQKLAKMTGFMFNIDGGYLEGLCRGFKCGILKQSDYLNLVQCETLEGEQSKIE